MVPYSTDDIDTKSFHRALLTKASAAFSFLWLMASSKAVLPLFSILLIAPFANRNATARAESLNAALCKAVYYKSQKKIGILNCFPQFFGETWNFFWYALIDLSSRTFRFPRNIRSNCWEVRFLLFPIIMPWTITVPLTSQLAKFKSNNVYGKLRGAKCSRWTVASGYETPLESRRLSYVGTS